MQKSGNETHSINDNIQGKKPWSHKCRKSSKYRWHLSRNAKIQIWVPYTYDVKYKYMFMKTAPLPTMPLLLQKEIRYKKFRGFIWKGILAVDWKMTGSKEQNLEIWCQVSILNNAALLILFFFCAVYCVAYLRKE